MEEGRWNDKAGKVHNQTEHAHSPTHSRHVSHSGHNYTARGINGELEVGEIQSQILGFIKILWTIVETD